jgi:hypothetical protein
MKGHIKVIGRSLLSLVATIAIGGGVTYALFQSNQVTLSQTTLSTGTADLRICNSNQSTPTGSNTWKNSISPVLSIAGLTPGGSYADVTPNSRFFFGNDNGSLATTLGTECTTYESGVTPGTSTTSYKLVPTLSGLNCTDDTGTAPFLRDSLNLRFVLGATTSTGHNLAYWATNTGKLSPTFLPGEVNQLKLEAYIDSAYSTQGQTCTFDINFVGQQ